MSDSVDDAVAVGRPAALQVLMFSWEYPPHVNGGMGNHVRALTSALAGRGVELHLVTPRHNGGEPIETVCDGLTVHRVEPAPWRSGDILTDAHEANSRMTSYAGFLVGERGPFDLVHAHDWLVALSAFHFKHEYRWPLVATIHATERGRCGGGVTDPLSVTIDHIEWHLCYEAWRLIVTSRFMAGELMDTFRVPRDKLDVVSNGVELWRFQQLDDAALTGFRRRFARDDERLVFHVGRLVHEKGAQTLVAAAPAILAEFPATRFVIAGRGPLYHELTKLASDLGVSERFHFAGFVADDDRDRLYRVADVAVFPSLYEPFGMVVLEAMAAGVPVVVSNTGGLAEVVEPHVTGLVHEPGNAGSLAWAVRAALRQPAQARARAQVALARVRELFTWEQVADQTAAVYARVVREREAIDW